MIKRLLAVITLVSMLVTILCAVPVSAATTLPDNIGTDYVAGAVTGNMIAAGETGLVGYAWNGDYTYSFNGAGSIVIGSVSDKYVYFKPTVDIGNILDSKTNSVAGYIVKTTKPADQTGRVVWSFSFKADQSGKDLFVNVGRRNEGVASGSEAYIEYPVEYNGSDKGVVPTLGYQAYTGSFDDRGVPSEKYTYEIGFVKGTVAQAMARIDSTQSYIGYEYAHDIKVIADKTVLKSDTSVELSAEILNQVGSKGGLSQNVTWYALNQERTAQVSGINITDNGDGTAAVTVENNVEAGTYVIVAVSDEYPELVEGKEITVEIAEKPDVDNPGENNPDVDNPEVDDPEVDVPEVDEPEYDDSEFDYTDYVPNKEENPLKNNMVTDGKSGLWGYASSGDYSYGHNGKGSIVIGAAGDKVYFKPTADIVDVLDSKDEPVAGYIVKTTKPAGMKGRVVWSFSFKADQEGKAMLINVGRKNESAAVGSDAYIEYPIEYNGSDKGIVPTTGYQTYTGTFEDKGVSSEKYTYEIGFVKGTVAQAMARIDSTQSYIAYEYPYDISVSVETAKVYQGDIVNVKANVVNQLGAPYGGKEKITWKAMNTSRDSFIEGITFTTAEDGTTVAEIGENVPCGSYDIVAVLGNCIMAKGTRITVEERDLISNLSLSGFSGDTVTATAKLMNKTQKPLNAVLVVVMVDAENEILDITTKSISNIKLSDGMKEYEEELKATDITKVAKAKAFLLDCGNSATSLLSDTTLVELALSQTIEKQ